MNICHLLTVASLVALPVALIAQNTEGTITYTKTTTLKLNMPPQFQPPGGQLPQTQTQQVELLFSGQQSLLRPIAQEQEEQEADGPVLLVIGPGADQQEVFTDLSTGTTCSRNELGAKTYLVDDSLKHETWKLTSDTKLLLGFTCHKATAERISWRKMMAMENGVTKMDSVLDTLRFVAWYADGFVCSSGPAAAGSLPGMVLEFDNGRVHYVATAFTPKTEKKAIVAPKGKRITAADYRIVEADYRRRLMGERGMPPPPPRK